MDLSLVVPCYNEAPHLRASVGAIREVLDTTPYDYEIVFVDDGSSDETRDIIDDICASTPRCRAVFHEKNRGRGAAFKTGFRASKGRITGFLDIDLEVAAHHIPPLVQLIDLHGADVATGRRHYLIRQTGAWHRVLLSSSYRWLVRSTIAPGVRDSETGCKFFRRDTASDVVLGSESDGWFWDSEVMARAVLAGLEIRELDVLFLRRRDKRSTVRLGSDVLDYLGELHRFRRKVGCSLLHKSPVYWNGTFFDATMRALYGTELDRIYADVAAEIDDGTDVVDLCCGTARLYRDHLRERGCRYLGLDFNGRFVLEARRRGDTETRFFNALTDPIPLSDYVTMVSSLYHFYDRPGDLITRMKQSARRAAIVSEPVRNWSNRRSMTGKLAAALSDPGVGSFHNRFGLDELRNLAAAHGASRVVYHEGDRNAVVVFPGEARQVTKSSPPESQILRAG